MNSSKYCHIFGLLHKVKWRCHLINLYKLFFSFICSLPLKEMKQSLEHLRMSLWNFILSVQRPEFYSSVQWSCASFERVGGSIWNDKKPVKKSFRFEHDNLGPHRKSHAQLNKIAEEIEKAHNKIRCSEEMRAEVLLNLNS